MLSLHLVSGRQGHGNPTGLALHTWEGLHTWEALHAWQALHLWVRRPAKVARRPTISQVLAMGHRSIPNIIRLTSIHSIHTMSKPNVLRLIMGQRKVGRKASLIHTGSITLHQGSTLLERRQLTVMHSMRQGRIGIRMQVGKGDTIIQVYPATSLGMATRVCLGRLAKQGQGAQGTGGQGPIPLARCRCLPTPTRQSKVEKGELDIVGPRHLEGNLHQMVQLTQEQAERF